MNKTLASRLVVGALAAIAAGGVMAGQIQSSSTPIAREVITADDMNIVSPQIAYRFTGDVTATANHQVFQMQFTLSAGKWVAVPGDGAFSITDGISNVVQDQTAGAPGGGAQAAYQIVGKGLTADGKTLWVTFDVAQGPNATIRQPLISVNTTKNTINGVALTDVSAQRNEINNLKSVVGDIVADYEGTAGTNDNNFAAKCIDNKEIKVDIKHFIGLANPAAMAVAGTNGTPDEHTRAASTNEGTLFTFPTNIKINVEPSTGAVRLSPGGSMQFQMARPGEAFVNPTLANMGKVTLVQNAVGSDANVTDKYLLSAGPGVLGQAPATRNDGPVEVESFKVKVYASNGFVPGGRVFISEQVNCGTDLGGVDINAANAAGPVTPTVPTGSINTLFPVAGTGPAYICYRVPGAETIPASSFWARADLDKPTANPNLFEQDNVCNGQLFGMGGGLKIDVRNYAPAAGVATSGWMSVIRLINNSDSSAADVYAQIIHQDGKIGKWGKIAQLPVRGVTNLTSPQLEAMLVNEPEAADANANNGEAANLRADENQTGAPRLRITSNTAQSLRVQNYVVNNATGEMFEASNSQGVDFEGREDRAAKTTPDDVSGQQFISQDANSGLNLR
ncbi:hypothetical protein [Dentiradicibacter hellwigii]|uniref:Uncharacterized protein n=1 Tax=Dentiradicibacter hellwigii TaxID=3149053 RepID=A0ABV4UHD4_9RHOO